MKKILIGILIILLFVMAYVAIFRGISIGSFQILSVAQIGEENDKLSKEITQTEGLIHKDYPTQTENLEASISKLLIAKNEYLDLANVSTDSELSKANKQETYKIEYLWTKIGSYATAEGITLKLDVTAGETGESNVKNLSFNISGRYAAIILFIEDLEDDSQLGFRIENFKIVQGSGEGSRQVTFIVRNVRIKQESTTAIVNSTKDTNQTDSKNNDPANNTKNTNNNTTTNNNASNNTNAQNTDNGKTKDNIDKTNAAGETTKENAKQ